MDLPRYRNLPDHPIAPAAVAARGWHAEDLLLPSAVLHGEALQHNAELFAAWCAQLGVSHAPHVKTHLSPQLLALLREQGTWGVTVAGPAQARLVVAMGARQVLLANEVVDRPGLTLLAGLIELHPDLQLTTLVDSVALVDLLADAWGFLRPGRRLRVLVELGVPGQRSGARGHQAALEVARAAAARPELHLVGVEGFEGVLASNRQPETVRQVQAQFAEMTATLQAMDAEGLLGDADEVLFTAGGSFFPDLAAAAGKALPGLNRPVRTVIRSGCAITHEHGPTVDCIPLSAAARHPLGALRPALEVWGHVLSLPEPGRAIASFGKRDVSYDLALPVLLRATRGGAPLPLHPDTAVVRLFDQNAYLDHHGEFALGDVLVVGPVHPCTTFDKWPLIPVLDGQHRVVDAVTTHF